jgi:hypothetical protein
MAIRRMLFPLFIIAIVFLAVNFIRPAVLSVLDQREAKDVKLAELASVEKTAANIGSLSDSRDTVLGSEEGALIMSYLPIGSDHDRIADIFNYISIQSGAVIGNISFGGGTAAAPRAPTADIIGADGSVIQTPPTAPVPPAFLVTVDIDGAYENVKSFMQRVSSVDRLHRVMSFSVSKRDPIGAPQADGQPLPDDGILSAQLEVEFPYLPVATYPSAHLLPVFSTGSFDMESVRRIMESGDSIPTLPEPALPEKRADPFK